MQLISPRQQQAWAASYQQRAARLEAEGRMQPSGRAILERAGAAGTVDAMSDVDALVVPQDLQDRLTARSADAWWTQAAPSYRRNILRWIVSAKSLKPANAASRLPSIMLCRAKRCQTIERCPTCGLRCLDRGTVIGVLVLAACG